MAPIFARLGVRLITRNMGNGGLGTLQASLGMSWIYGDEIDLLLWDSKMTEGSGPDQDIFIRQGLIGGKRVPVILGMEMNSGPAQLYYDLVDAEIGSYGVSLDGVPLSTSAKQVKELPWAVQYLSCTPDSKELCKYSARFCRHCWIDPTGDGSIVPPTEQNQDTDEKGNWHPGWREHQLRGRSLSMGILKVLRDAIDLWTDNVRG